MLGEREAVEAVYVKRIFSYRRKDIFVAEAREPSHTCCRGSQGCQVGTGTGPIRITIYIWISEVRLISDLILLMGLCLTEKPHQVDVSDLLKLLP
jgi:hypothetical protein